MYTTPLPKHPATASGFFVIFFSLLMHAGFARQNYLDSCLNALRNHPDEDTVHLNLLNEIAFEYNYSNPQTGLEFADRAIALAEKLKHPRKLASGYSHKGVNYAALGNHEGALKMYTQALTIHTQIGNRVGIAGTLNNMAIVQVNKGNYAEALEYYTQAFAVLEQLGDKYRMATALNNIGVVYLYLADYRRALDYYLRALKIQEQLGQSKALADNFTNIGIIYKNLGNYEKAIEYHQRALSLYESEKILQGSANALGNIGVAYDNAGDTTNALEYFKKALVINREIGSNKQIAGDLTNLGVLYKGCGQYAEGMDYLQQALQLYTDTEDKNNMISVLNHLARIYIDAPDTALRRMGVQSRDRHVQAQQYLARALPLAQAIGAPDRLSEVWKSLSDVYTARRDFGNALHAYRQHVVFRDSVYNVNTQKELTRRVMQFEFEKTEAQSMAAIARQRWINRNILIGAGVVFLALICSFIFYKRKRDAETQRKEAELRAEAAELEMKALRLQMNPHFIFNSLNSISDYIIKNDVEQADYYLAKFARLIRLILENSEQPAVSLATDLEALQLYLQLESVRHNNRFSWEIITGDNIDKENTFVPPMLLQPLVENSILHGMAGKKEGGRITVRMEARGNHLVCTVEDNGPGLATQGTASHSGKQHSMGLTITRARIAMISKAGARDAGFAITSLSPGVRATVTLPLEW